MVLVHDVDNAKVLGETRHHVRLSSIAIAGCDSSYREGLENNM